MFSLPNGGAVALVWGVSSLHRVGLYADTGQWSICATMLMFVALALAELASAAPTSGGLYYWSYKYASPKWRNLCSWIVGCKSLAR